MSYEIQNDMPMGYGIRRQRNSKYPLRELQPGQSFDVPEGDESLGSLRTYATHMGKQLRKKFSVSTTIRPGFIRVKCISEESK